MFWVRTVGENCSKYFSLMALSFSSVLIFLDSTRSYGLTLAFSKKSSIPLKEDALLVAVDLPDEAALLGLGPINLLLII